MASEYGMKLYAHGVELRSDGRWRERHRTGPFTFFRDRSRDRPKRGVVRAWSKASARRLSFIAANADLFFAAHLTLTYRANQQEWETAGDRNRRVVARCQADRHRFLRCLRDEIGEYLWVREFQKRGVVHFHALTERPISQGRAAEAWARASDQLHDGSVLRHGVKVDEISSQRGVRHYLGQYIGKEKQKELPVGVGGAGRWWGRSRGLKLAKLDDIVWLDREDEVRRPIQLRIVRVLRKFVERRFKRSYWGGAFVDYGGKLSSLLGEMAGQLKAHYGWSPTLPEMLEQFGWEVIEDGEVDGDAGPDQQTCSAGEAEGTGGEGRSNGHQARQVELWEA